MRGGLQHPLAAAHDRQEGGDLLAAGFFAPVPGCGSAADVATGAAHIAPAYAQRLRTRRGLDMGMGKSGTTK